MLRWLLPRLQTQQDKDIVHKDLLNEQGQMQDKYIENSYIEFQTELVRFLDMDEAKEIYLNASFIYEASPSADDDDIDDFFSDSAESAHGQESNNETYLTELKEKEYVISPGSLCIKHRLWLTYTTSRTSCRRMIKG